MALKAQAPQWPPLVMISIAHREEGFGHGVRGSLRGRDSLTMHSCLPRSDHDAGQKPARRYILSEQLLVRRHSRSDLLQFPPRTYGKRGGAKGSVKKRSGSSCSVLRGSAVPAAVFIGRSSGLQSLQSPGNPPTLWISGVSAAAIGRHPGLGG